MSEPNDLQDPELVEAIKTKLDGVGLPILSIHEDESQAAFAMIVTSEHWVKIMSLIAPGQEITDLVMQHEHVVGSGYYEEPLKDHLQGEVERYRDALRDLGNS